MYSRILNFCSNADIGHYGQTLLTLSPIPINRYDLLDNAKTLSTNSYAHPKNARLSLINPIYLPKKLSINLWIFLLSLPNNPGL